MATFYRSLRIGGQRLAQSWWPVCVIALLTAGIVYQRWQYTHPNRPGIIKVGDRIPPVELETLHEQKVHINWAGDGKSTIVYAFTPACVWCKKNIESMRAVARGTSDYHFIAVSLAAEGLHEYVAANHFDVPVYLAYDERTKKHLKVTVTPETIVVSPDGIVKRVWFGAYTGKVGSEIEQVFGVRLPVLPASL